VGFATLGNGGDYGRNLQKGKAGEKLKGNERGRRGGNGEGE